MIEFKTFNELSDLINSRLGGFCNEFGLKRKELAGLKKAPKRGRLFSTKHNWAINEGGGTEIQYHIVMFEETLSLKYGLGFNTQYVPFNNKMTPVDYIKPFIKAFLKNEKKIRSLLPDYEFVDNNYDLLITPKNDQYVLFGKVVSIEKGADNYRIKSDVFDQIIDDFKSQFEAYQLIFEKRNALKNMTMNNDNIIDVLRKKKQIILQGPPGTGKTYTAKDMAERIIFSNVSEDKKVQKTRLEDSEHFQIIQFHPAYSYEDFVRGIVAKSKGDLIEYATENKGIVEFAANANKNWKASDNPKEEAQETWLENTLEDFKEYLLTEIEDREDKLMITGKAYISRVTENSIRYNSDAWEADGGVPISDIIKMYSSHLTTRREIKDHKNLTKTAKSLSTYWLKILELFRKYVDVNNLKPEENINTVKVQEYVLIIDEINRANLPAVLGELIYALEYRGEQINSMYAIDEDTSIVIPPNLLIIGTMNTADRSVGHIDYAIRRRFAFIDVLPKVLEETNFQKELFEKVSGFFIKNYSTYIDGSTSVLEKSEHLSDEFIPEDVWLGHSYFIDNDGDFEMRKKYEIIPILKEYVKDGILKQSAKALINQL